MKTLPYLQNLNLYAELRGRTLNQKKIKPLKNLFQFTGLAPFKDRLAGELIGRNETKAWTCMCLDEKSRPSAPFRRT